MLLKVSSKAVEKAYLSVALKAAVMVDWMDVERVDTWVGGKGH